MGTKKRIGLLFFNIFYIWLAGCSNPTAPATTALQLPSASAPSKERITLTQTREPIVTPTLPPVFQAPPDGSPGRTGNADVLYVRAIFNPDGKSWTFYVTVSHPDTGWEDYADGWDVVMPDGSVLKPDPASPFTRLLLHPHETEQPFIRSQSGIMIPPGIDEVTVRAHDLIAGFGGMEVRVDLTVAAGQGFEVSR